MIGKWRPGQGTQEVCLTTAMYWKAQVRFMPLTRGGAWAGLRPPQGAPARSSLCLGQRLLSPAQVLAVACAADLMAEVQSAVQAGLEGVTLAQPLDAEGLGRLLSDMLARLTQSARAAGWDSFLLPSPSALSESLLAPRPDNRALAASGGMAQLVDREAVEGMLGEVRRIVSSDKFHVTLVACVRELSREAVGKLCDRVTDHPLPLAKLVPFVAAVGQDFLTPGTPCIPRLAQLEEVHSLCAMVYSCGPPL